MSKKKKRNTVVLIIIISVVIFIMYKANWENPLPSVINNSYVTENSIVTSSSDVQEFRGTTTNSNLCSLITPYVFVFNLQNVCNENGGTWACESGRVGCYNLAVPLIDCNLAVVQTALSQCRATNSISYCDSQNVYCTY